MGTGMLHAGILHRVIYALLSGRAGALGRAGVLAFCVMEGCVMFRMWAKRNL
jgi:hypothetical protein